MTDHEAQNFASAQRRSAPTSAMSAFDDAARLQLLRLLSDHPGLSQRELAQRLGMSLGKTNYCLRALIDKGWVKVNNFRNSRNKLAYAYVLTPSGMQEKLCVTLAFLRRKQHEYRQLECEIAALRQEVARFHETRTVTLHDF